MLGTFAALAFDVTSVLALMYPGRERVEVVATDGTTQIYACKPGPNGETPQQQAEKAQAAFEANVEAITSVLVGEMLAGADTDKPSLQVGFEVNQKLQSWAGSNFAHLEKEYGCALLG